MPHPILKKAVDHHEANRMIAAEESARGHVRYCTIIIDPSAGHAGWTPTPDCEVSAFLVTDGDSRGYLYANEMDDYGRYDLVDERFCQEVEPAVLMNPAADRERQRVEAAERQREEQARLESQIQTVSRRLSKRDHEKAYAALVDANAISGLPLVSVAASFARHLDDIQVADPGAQPPDAALRRRVRLAETVVAEVGRFYDDYGHRAQLSLDPGKALSEQERQAAILNQISSQRLEQELGLQVVSAEVEADGPDTDSGVAVTFLKSGDGALGAPAIFSQWKVPLESRRPEPEGLPRSLSDELPEITRLAVSSAEVFEQGQPIEPEESAVAQLMYAMEERWCLRADLDAAMESALPNLCPVTSAADIAPFVHLWLNPLLTRVVSTHIALAERAAEGITKDADTSHSQPQSSSTGTEIPSMS